MLEAVLGKACRLTGKCGQNAQGVYFSYDCWSFKLGTEPSHLRQPFRALWLSKRGGFFSLSQDMRIPEARFVESVSERGSRKPGLELARSATAFCSGYAAWRSFAFPSTAAMRLPAPERPLAGSSSCVSEHV